MNRISYVTVAVICSMVLMSVAILELKKRGGHCGAKEKEGG